MRSTKSTDLIGHIEFLLWGQLNGYSVTRPFLSHAKGVACEVLQVLLVAVWFVFCVYLRYQNNWEGSGYKIVSNNIGDSFPMKLHMWSKPDINICSSQMNISLVTMPDGMHFFLYFPSFPPSFLPPFLPAFLPSFLPHSPSFLPPSSGRIRVHQELQVSSWPPCPFSGPSHPCLRWTQFCSAGSD